MVPSALSCSATRLTAGRCTPKLFAIAGVGKRHQLTAVFLRAFTWWIPACTLYIVGGLVPLAPYFFFRSVHTALAGSVAITLLALMGFGYVKGRFTTARPFRSAWQTVIVGGLAATAAFVIAKAIG